ncbi:MAG: hypothetical protein QW203_08085 [Thermoplasmatales archaeon]
MRIVNLLRDLRNDLRKYKGAVLLDSVYAIPIALEAGKATFIDHGLWNTGTHNLLHELFNHGISIDFRYNVNALTSIENGYIRFDLLSDENKSEVIKLLGEIDRIPYSMDNWVTRHLLWEIPYSELKASVEYVFRGMNYENEANHMRGKEIYPCLQWNKDDLNQYLAELNIKLEGDEFSYTTVKVDLKNMISETLAKKKKLDEFEKVKENLKSWGYM